jgi:hypothetical protein
VKEGMSMSGRQEADDLGLRIRWVRETTTTTREALEVIETDEEQLRLPGLDEPPELNVIDSAEALRLLEERNEGRRP